MISPSRRLIAWLCFGLSWIVATCQAWEPASREAGEFFERKVRPILAANCFLCHGEKKQEGELRLDSREAVLKGGSTGTAAQPGSPEQSTLYQAVQWSGELKMPPEKPLRPEEVAVLKHWIQGGLAWPADAAKSGESWRLHWAFQPLRRVIPSPVRQADWPRTAIDQYILVELERAQLAPAAEADRRTLIRRLYLDLLGFPPTPAEVADFEADPASDAWERLVARTLASPRYGERWGRHWLDVARYADTKGYVFFEEKKYPWAYTYRDYVIDALNRDLPYDRFVLEQLAADQVDEPSTPGGYRRSLTALGFLTVGGHFMNNTHDIIDDRIDVVTRGLLGLTATCGRCHDHKYDPVTMADYYGLYGVFRSCYEPTVLPMFEAPPADDNYRKFATEMATREKALVDFVTQKHGELVRDSQVRAAEYLQAAYKQRDQPPTDDFMLLVEKGDLNPTMILRWQNYLGEHRTGEDPVWGLWHTLAALPPANFAAECGRVLEHQGNDSPRSNRLVVEALRRQPLASMEEVVGRYGELMRGIEDQWQAHCKAATMSGGSKPERLDDPAAEELRQVLYGAGAPPDVPLAMDWGFLSLFPDRPTQGEYQKLLKSVEEWMMTAPGAPPRAMVLRDAEQSYEPRVFLRGNPHRLGDKVPRQYLAALSTTPVKPFGPGSGRLELARAIVDPSNPLTARVIVNRVWMHHFGNGLVRTPGDFGVRSDPPTHPELLDWLALEFMNHGWSLKWLHQEILRSACYRQAPDPSSSQTLAGDPDGRLLSRFPRRRLEFEAQRDSLLAVADSLDSRLGGPPQELLGESVVPRRTIYGLIDRMDVPPLLTTFDFPNPLTTNPQRNVTTIAPQALYEMNHRFVMEIARRVVERPDVSEGTDREARVSRLFQLLFQREPTAAESDLAQQFLGDSPTAETWKRFGQALLLTNEFGFLE